jgi:hypothetical protein
MMMRRLAQLSSDLQEESDPIETTFELNDTLYAKASIPPTEEVYLWLGVRKVKMFWDIAH